MDADIYELSKNSEVVIEFDLEKILKIERFLIERGVSKNTVTEYALAIYNRRGGDIDIIIKDTEERLRLKMMRDDSIGKRAEEISKKNTKSEE